MIPEQVLFELLRNMGVIIRNSHFVYTSGRHGSTYINKDGLYPDPRCASFLGLAIAQRVAYLDIETVIAPAVGGVILSQWIAHHLIILTQRDVNAVYAEKSWPFSEDGTTSGDAVFVIKRGYPKFVCDKSVLVVDDILNTGGSALGVVKAVRQIGGTVAAVAALCNRGNLTADNVGNPPHFIPLTTMVMESWDPRVESCPLCTQGIPINTTFGKGAEYVAKRNATSLL